MRGSSGWLHKGRGLPAHTLPCPPTRRICERPAPRAPDCVMAGRYGQSMGGMPVTRHVRTAVQATRLSLHRTTAKDRAPLCPSPMALARQTQIGHAALARRQPRRCFNRRDWLALGGQVHRMKSPCVSPTWLPISISKSARPSPSTSPLTTPLPNRNCPATAENCADPI